MKSVLLVYGTWAGSTAGVASQIGTTLKSLGARVTVVPAGSAPDPTAYDAVVVGSAVRSTSWHPAVIAWCEKHCQELQAKPVALFSVCLTPAMHPERVPEARGYSLPVCAEHEIRPISIGGFSGAYDPLKLSLGDRVRARLWGAKPGDFRDMDEVDGWATRVATLLQV